ncbi:MAG: alkyl sulfatase C-terminal domain-containing protein, partial [Methanothrix sp.]|nr:alkyl sulfatase C-terminal domain-containing protein [Methanothrix sp.]
VFADPANMQARKMEAAALEQLGYQAESGPARNAYLVGAQELRSTEPVQGRTMISADIMSAMSSSQLLDFLAVRLNASKADGADYRINLIINGTGDGTGDQTDDKALIQVNNSVLNFWLNESASNADVTVDMPRKSLEQLALNPSSPVNGMVCTGDCSVFESFVGMLDTFDSGFNIVLP